MATAEDDPVRWFVRRWVLGLLPFVAVIAVLMTGGWAFGGLFGLSPLQTVAALGALGVFTYIVATSGDELSFPFWLTFVPLLLAVFGFLPEPIAAAFDPVFDVFGVDPGAVDAVQLLILGAVATVAYWAVQWRAGSGTNRASTITGKIFGSGRDGRKGDLTKLVEDYVTMGRVVVGFGLAVVAIFASQAGVLAGEATQFLADAPLVASNIFTALFGWAALGGSLPGWLAWIPGLEALLSALAGFEPGAYLFVVILALALAYGLEEGVLD